MFLYRGKEIGGRRRLTETCLGIIREGSAEEIYNILPHIRVIRSADFFQPLVDLLNSPDSEKKAAGALALGSLGDPRAIQPLQEVFTGSIPRLNLEVQSAIITALGEIPHSDSALALMDIHRLKVPKDYQKPQRPRFIISSLGQLAQQGIWEAEVQLNRMLNDPREEVRAAAATEISLAYWHRPNQTPQELLERIYQLATEDEPEVQAAASGSLLSLAQLGCKDAERYVARLDDSNR